ncbi:hypothetical protein ACHAWF_003470 [Thalassiosira exigua]
MAATTTALLLARSKGVLALAWPLSLNSPQASPCIPFRNVLRLQRASVAAQPSRTHASANATPLCAGDAPTPDAESLADEGDYEWLKRSRPIRIHARLLRPKGNLIGSSKVTKIVHFQRHGQGTHNELYRQWTERTGEPPDLSEPDPRKNPMMRDDVVDAPLTEKGRRQCEEQRSTAAGLDGIELVVSSPLARTLQTAHCTFEDHLPYNAQREVKWMAHEGVREELGQLLCNKRRPLSETEFEFPEVDYTHMPYEEDDVVWNNHVEKTSKGDGIPKRETTVDMSHRAYQFLVGFLHKRPEREIAVVGHSAWLFAMTNAVLDAGDDESLIRPMFKQAELRSMELIFLER